jgi:hypothetical protein
MDVTAREFAALRALIERGGGTPGQLQLRPRRLGGGLEAAAVTRVGARYRDERGRSRSLAVVLKRIVGDAGREALLYERLVAPHAAALSPQLLGLDRSGPGETTLYLEAVNRSGAWPWRESGAALAVLRSVAQLHTTAPGEAALEALRGWDYDAELALTAERTVEILERVRRLPNFPWLGPPARAARRLLATLPELRRQLLAAVPFGTTVIHGDLHPGNAVLRRRCGGVVLLDWGRARLGSPLEDVSSWLFSLGGWEPEARRRHDTLLSGYLAARGWESRLTAPLRAAYWLAGASNVLAGALLHHLTIATDPGVSPLRRGVAARAAFGWGRVLRRADAWWR